MRFHNKWLAKYPCSEFVIHENGRKFKGYKKEILEKLGIHSTVKCNWHKNASDSHNNSKDNNQSLTTSEY